MSNKPIVMEKYFKPGFKTKPAVHIGSQTIPLFHGIAEEQAYEGYYLAAASEGDVAIVRNFEPSYISYWKKLIGEHSVINLTDTDPGEFKTQAILDNPKVIKEIKDYMHPKSKLHVFSPTRLEQELADKLGIPLHGDPEFSERYGTKSGIRKLANEYGIPMSPGFICKNVKEVESAISLLRGDFKDVVIKFDHSLGGYFSKKVHISNRVKVKELLDEILGEPFHDDKYKIVVEGWLNSSATPCAHIEILKDQDPIICAGWQQIVDKDGVSRIGAGPLMISSKAMKTFLDAVKELAWALKDKGAIGSFGPDFLITEGENGQISADTAVLIELNARIPMTAIALEIILNVRGRIGSGFLAMHLKLESRLTFNEMAKKLDSQGVLIRQKGKAVRGVIPFNVGLLPFKMIDLVAMADTWDETQDLMRKAERILHAVDV